MAQSSEALNGDKAASIKLLRGEKIKVDQQIAELQARSRAYDLAIMSIDADLRRPVEQPAPQYTPGQQYTPPQAEGIAEVFAAAVKDKKEAVHITKEDVLRDLQANAHNSPNAFVVPNETARKSGTPISEAKVVRSYDEVAGISPEYLVSVHSVLAGLAASDYKGNRAHIWPVDVQEKVTLPNTVKDRATQEAVNTLKGQSAIGFDIAVLRVNAAAFEGESREGYLYMIDDKLRNKLFVMGPTPVGRALKAALQKNGVTYVTQDDPDAMWDANEFLADGAKHRGNIGKLIQGNTQNVIELMLRACELAFDVKPHTDPLKGATVGKALREATNPKIYTNIVKPRI